MLERDRRIYGGETTNSEPLKEWTDKYYRQGETGERGGREGGEMELQPSVAG